MATTRVCNLPAMVVCLFVVYIYIYIYIYTHTHAAKIPNIFFLSGFLYGPWTFILIGRSSQAVNNLKSVCQQLTNHLYILYPWQLPNFFFSGFSAASCIDEKIFVDNTNSVCWHFNFKLVFQSSFGQKNVKAVIRIFLVLKNLSSSPWIIVACSPWSVLLVTFE